MTEDKTIPLIDIEPPEVEMRSYYEERKFEELKESIKTVGVLQPIVVRKKGDKYKIIMGCRRTRACLELGLDEIPARVLEGDETNDFAMTMHENLYREDVNHMDIASYLWHIVDTEKITYEELGKRFGFSGTWVSSHLKLLELPINFQNAVGAKLIDMNSALCLRRIPDEGRRDELLKIAIKDGASQAAIRRWVNDELQMISYAQGHQPKPATDEEVKQAPEAFFYCFCCKQKFSKNQAIPFFVDPQCFPVVKEAISWYIELATKEQGDNEHTEDKQKSNEDTSGEMPAVRVDRNSEV